MIDTLPREVADTVLARESTSIEPTFPVAAAVRLIVSAISRASLVTFVAALMLMDSPTALTTADELTFTKPAELLIVRSPTPAVPAWTSLPMVMSLALRSVIGPAIVEIGWLSESDWPSMVSEARVTMLDVVFTAPAVAFRTMPALELGTELTVRSPVFCSTEMAMFGSRLLGSDEPA